MGYLFDFASFIEELRENEVKKGKIDKYEELYGGIEPDIKKQIWYTEYVSKCIQHYPEAGLLVPEELKDDFDWPLLFGLTVSSFSSEYRFVIPDKGGEESWRLLIKVSAKKKKSESKENEVGEETDTEEITIEKDLENLWSFQILRLYEIYIEEQIDLQILYGEKDTTADHRYGLERQREKKIDELLNKLVVPDEVDNNRKIVYHYASINTLAAILESKQIRATDLRFLNDAKEGKVWDEVFSSAVIELRDRYKKEPFFDEINYYLDLIGDRVKSYMKPEVMECYITSFTRLADDKNQFHMYGDSFKGVSIGFDEKKLRKEIIDNSKSNQMISGLLYGEVNYNLPKLKQTVKGMLTKMINEFIREKKATGETPEEFRDNNLYFFNGRSDKIFLTCQDAKSEYFKSEEEYRLYWMQEPSSRSKHIRFFPRNSRIIPFVNFDFSETTLPIVEVIIGPNNDMNAVKENIQEVLRLYGYTNVAVKTSDIPYRP